MDKKTLPPRIYTNDGQKPGQAVVAAVVEGLEKAGLKRTSELAGGEYTGLIAPNSGGSTGFSVKFAASDPGLLIFHLVVSGAAAGLHYRNFQQYSESAGVMNMHEPLDPDSLCPRLKRVFEGLGYTIANDHPDWKDGKPVRSTGYQMHWDDDVDYEVVVRNPHDEAYKAPPRRRPW